MAKSNTIELDRPVPKAASLRPFKSEDEVLIIAGTMEGLRAKYWYPGDEPGTVRVYVYSWKGPQTVDEEHIIHARR